MKWIDGNRLGNGVENPLLLKGEAAQKAQTGVVS